MTNTTMTNKEGWSATIIPFPARGRAIGGGRRDPLKSATHNEAPRYAEVASGGAWYHEAAMREEAERTRKQ